MKGTLLLSGRQNINFMTNIISGGNPTHREIELRNKFFDNFKNSPIPDNELLSNLGLFIKSKDLKRILFFDDIYKRILATNGVIMEFGTRWGQNLALFESLRGIYEPFNLGRKIIGFDTFSGFVNIHNNDNKTQKHYNGDYGVTDHYEQFLEEVLTYHEQENPISHIKKFDIIKGDAGVKVEEYLNKHPEIIIAFAYFDMDLYEPTKACLELIKDHLTVGSIIGFDELNSDSFPGETLAVKEVLGLNRYKIQRNVYSSRESFLVIE